MLHVRPAKGGGLRKNWVLRYRHNGKRSDLGLGSYPEVDLPVARKKKDELRQSLATGIDAKDARDETARAARLDFLNTREVPTFEEMTHLAFENIKSDLKGGGVSGRWLSPLNIHVLPKIGQMRVTEINRKILIETLKPIWDTKHGTADKAMSRIGIILRFADSQEYSVDILAAQRARAGLAKVSKSAKGIPAMPWADVPAFYATLGDDSHAQLGLRFIILTATRTSETRFCRWEQIEGNVWTIPAENLKTYRPNRRVNNPQRVPLSGEAMRVLDLARTISHHSEWVFRTKTKDAPLSDMAFSAIMRKLRLEARPHGFRSSFRTYVAEQMPEVPPHHAEACLGHATAGAVEKAYLRTDLLELRNPIMQTWADHIAAGGIEK